MHELLTSLTDNRALIFYILLFISLLLTRIPIVGKYFRSINTMVHEGGHAFMTLLVSGELIAVNLFADTSGNTVTKSKNKFLQILIALSGYLISAGCGYFFLYLQSKGYYLHILFILVSLALLLMVLSIRNAYGLFWAGTFTLINLLLIYFNEPNSIYITAAFYSLIVMTDAVLSSFILLVISIKTPKKAGDASNLQKFTGIPAVVWALVFVLFSLLMAYYSVINYFPTFHGILG